MLQFKLDGHNTLVSILYHRPILSSNCFAAKDLAQLQLMAISANEPKEKTNVKILMVLTSHDQLGNTGRQAGFWLEEFAAPYFVFRDAGVQLTLASPNRGQPPLDPKSDLPES